MSRREKKEKISRGEKRLNKYLNEELYVGCKEVVASEGFLYNVDIKAYIEFYEFMIPPEQKELAGE